MQNGVRGILILLAGTTCTQAQWLNHPNPGSPRTGDGKPNLSARAPRGTNGKPDLSGVWEAESAPIEDLVKLLPGGLNGLGEDSPSKYFFNILSDFKPEDAPILPAAAAAYRQRAQGMGKDFPVTRCLPMGVPGAENAPAPYKIVQTPGLMVMLYEQDTSFRQVYTDGRMHPADPQPAWMGYSVGKWDGDTLVVDATGFNDRSWLDASGHTHSESLHVTERFRRRDFGHMEVQTTVEDPKTFTKPFTIKVNHRLLADTDLLESYCPENEKDVSHLGGR